MPAWIRALSQHRQTDASDVLGGPLISSHTVFGLFALAAAVALGGSARAESTPVGTALVLMTDVSASIDGEEYDLQRQGMARSFRDPSVIRAIWNQPYGAMAITVVEWSSTQNVVVPWTIIHDEATALHLAEKISRAQRTSNGSTHIGDAIMFGLKVLEDCPCNPARRVIDVSGDGASNGGALGAQEARDTAVALGVTINGLPIRDPVEPNVREYYEQYVIGGTGSFVAEANGFGDFARALRHKLVLEIAQLASAAAIP